MSIQTLNSRLSCPCCCLGVPSPCLRQFFWTRHELHSCTLLCPSRSSSLLLRALVGWGLGAQEEQVSSHGLQESLPFATQLWHQSHSKTSFRKLPWRPSLFPPSSMGIVLTLGPVGEETKEADPQGSGRAFLGPNFTPSWAPSGCAGTWLGPSHVHTNHPAQAKCPVGSTCRA